MLWLQCLTTQSMYLGAIMATPSWRHVKGWTLKPIHGTSRPQWVHQDIKLALLSYTRRFLCVVVGVAQAWPRVQWSVTTPLRTLGLLLRHCPPRQQPVQLFAFSHQRRWRKYSRRSSSTRWSLQLRLCVRPVPPIEPYCCCDVQTKVLHCGYCNNISMHRCIIS